MPTTAKIRRSAASGFAPMVRGLAGILACVPIALSAAQPTLPKASNLAADSESMRSARMPMVVLYSQASCSYCDEARSYLVPMSQEDGRKNAALFRQIDIDSDAPLTDFSGTHTTHRKFAAQHKARFTPTVVVLDASGTVVGEPIIGMRLPDFYGLYVENAIENARRAIGTNH